VREQKQEEHQRLLRLALVGLSAGPLPSGLWRDRGRWNDAPSHAFPHDRNRMTTMHFAREVKSYAEPVSTDELKEGSIYFFVNFVDGELLIPAMEPVVFVGKNLKAGEVGRMYFQNIYSFHEGTRYDTTDDEHPAEFHTGSADELGHVFEYEQALDVLITCSLRRRKSMRRTSDSK
jgi:hypothetical protein